MAQVRAAENSAEDTQLDRSVWKIIPIASFGSLLAQLDATIVNVVLSSLAADLHVSFSIIQWVTSGNLLALATTSLNISQRLGGSSITTLCATFPAWRLASHGSDAAVKSTYAWGFMLLCVLQVGVFLAARRLPRHLCDVRRAER